MGNEYLVDFVKDFEKTIAPEIMSHLYFAIKNSLKGMFS